MLVVNDNPAEKCRCVYVHVPFCTRFCGYCAFYSELAQPQWIDRYVRAVIRELHSFSSRLELHTLYFGGGTPTVLGIDQWQSLADEFLPLAAHPIREWTIEGNPGTITPDLAQGLKNLGANRFSLGIQSLNDALLERLGRAHNRDQAMAAFHELRHAGFNNINLDLMFAIPTQTIEQWDSTLETALALGSEHLSCYEVTFEEDTPLYQQLQAGQLSVNDDLACDMYELLVAHAEKQGVHPYEISNFARHELSQPAEFPSRACRHNINYWRGGDFIGLGPGASSYVGGRRWRNWANLERYCSCLEQGLSPVEESEQLSPQARAGELAAFGLRLRAGWPFQLFQQITGFDLRSDWDSEIRQMIALGYAEANDDRLRLTVQGLRYADWIAEQFLRS
jgi:oxygen-independent coproporphyrinogen III oxidase